MFLDDKLQQAYNQNPADYESLFKIIMKHITAKCKETKRYDNATVTSLVKQGDNSYRLFAKRNGLDEDYFRNTFIVAALATDILVGMRQIRSLGWCK